MTPLHRAARIGSPELVKMLMNLKADAPAATFPSRAPGSFTPLQCLAEADMSSIDKDDMQETTRLLLPGITTTAVGQRTTKGANVFHLVAARGNLACLEEIVYSAFPTLQPPVIRKLLNEKKASRARRSWTWLGTTSRSPRSSGTTAAWEPTKNRRRQRSCQSGTTGTAGTTGPSGRSLARRRPRVIGGKASQPGKRGSGGDHGLWPDGAGIRRSGNHTFVPPLRAYAEKEKSFIIVRHPQILTVNPQFLTHKTIATMFENNLQIFLTH